MQIFVDFDGTITSRDSIVYLTETFGGGPEYRKQVLRRIETGEIAVFEAIEEELATVRVSWEEAARHLKEQITVDPHFPSFLAWCRARGYPVQVVSSGIEQVVEWMIGPLQVPFSAHPVQIAPEGWVYRRREESDKVTILKQARGQGEIVYVGDGTSDVAVLPYVDFLFAKSYLARYCSREGIVYFPFEDFRDVQRGLEELAHRGSSTRS